MSLLLNRGITLPSQAGFIALPELEKHWIDRFLLFKERTIPVASTRLKPADRLGSWAVRWGIGRMKYRVLPGLYATGEPDSGSPVFVTANYKMSFDALRASLAGIDAWILVLDTGGVNVWCAAGKGSFGTQELASRITTVKLSSIISHRTLILPQLAASGVSAPEVFRKTGYRIQWGPVRASDIPAWLKAGRVKDETMREVSFTLGDRMAVAPIELVHAWPVALASLLLGGIFGLPLGRDWLYKTIPAVLILMGSIPVGTLLFPAILPWLPFRAFAAKGAVLGAVWALVCGLIFGLPIPVTLAGLLIVTPLVAFFAMNFTGASTFTSQPGALLEVEKSFWPMIGSLGTGLALAIIMRLSGTY